MQLDISLVQHMLVGAMSVREDDMLGERRRLPATIAAGAILWAGTALAQTTPPSQPSTVTQRGQQLPPGDPLIGQPDNPDAMKLAPVSGPVLPTRADKLPTAMLHVPEGFKVEVFASGLPDARSMRLGDKVSSDNRN